MSETTIATTETETETAPVESPFRAILAKTDQPDVVTNMIAEKLDGLFALVIRHNSRALRIQQTKAADPNNETLLDSIWENAANSKTAPADILEIEAKYQDLREECEAILKTLRAFAKTKVEQPLSADQVEKERKTANEEAKLIADETAAAEAFAKIADQYLEIAGESVEGGILSLIPPVESLKNTRGGKKSTGGTSSSGSYRTRLDSVSINGKKVERGGKSNFIVAADILCKEWNVAKFPENTVTDEVLERAMYAAHNTTFRDSGSLPPSLSFEYSREIKVQNPNDNSAKLYPVTVKFDIVRNIVTKKSDETETPAATTVVDGETAKVEGNSENVAENTSPETTNPETPVAESATPESAADEKPLTAKQKALQAKAAQAK